MKITIRRLKSLVNESASGIVPDQQFDYATLKLALPTLAKAVAQHAVESEAFMDDDARWTTMDEYESLNNDIFMVVRKDDPTWDYVTPEVEGFPLEKFGDDYMLLLFSDEDGGPNVTLVWGPEGWVG